MEVGWNRVPVVEEEQAIREKLIEFKLYLVYTEKGVSGLCTLVVTEAAVS